MAINAQPVPPPDLVTGNVAGPGTAFDGTTITVQYQVTNLGTGVTFPGTWTDAIWLTLGKDRPNPGRGDVLLGTFTHNGALDVNQFYTNSVQVTLPAHISGQYFLTAWTNSTDNVFQVTLNTNINPDDPHHLYSENYKATPLTIVPSPLADLQVTNVTAPATAVGGAQVTLTWTVANHGSVATDSTAWADGVYISTMPTLISGDYHFVAAVEHDGALDAGQTYTVSATFTLPPSAQGSFFIVKTNDANAIELLNGGTTLDQEVAQIVGGLLGTPTTSSGTVLQQATEESTTNNTLAAASTITDIPSDLAVTNLQVPATSFSGEPVTVTWSVKNQGQFAVYSGTQFWNDFVYLSPAATFNVNDATLVTGIVIQVVTRTLNRRRQSSPASTSVAMPEGISGPRYIYVLADRDGSGLDPLSEGDYPSWPAEFSTRVWEGNDPNAKANNFGGSGPIAITYREADLVISNLVVGTPQNPITAGMSGDTIPVQFTVTNVGNRATRVDDWFDRVFISQDASLDVADELLGSTRRAPGRAQPRPELHGEHHGPPAGRYPGPVPDHRLCRLALR